MGTRALQRSARTMRSMLAVYAEHGTGPSLQAVTTIYNNLLCNGAGGAEWALFNQVAQLPLTMQVFERACKLGMAYNIKLGTNYEEPCNNYPHCGHKNVAITKVVKLAGSDVAKLHNGRTIDRQLQAKWWGKQLGDALCAEVLA